MRKREDNGLSGVRHEFDAQGRDLKIHRHPHGRSWQTVSLLDSLIESSEQFNSYNLRQQKGWIHTCSPFATDNLYHFSMKSSELSSYCCYTLCGISNVLQSTNKKQRRRTAVQQMSMYNGTQPFTGLEDSKSSSKHQKLARWGKIKFLQETTASLETSGLA